ncbi:MAG: stage 0 sporulation family protein [Lachnospiraceae bacterium]|nr:stage 0 sporulation family protein [Lachnospiraceae bacterium]
MMKVIAVRFKSGGKSYFFDPGEIELVKDDYCIVETVKGIEYAQVVSDIRDVDDARITVPLRKVLRKATDADTKQVADNADKEKNAYRIAQEKILEHGLDMKLTDVEYAFDNSKIVFFFVAEQRVDFRDLVKDLAGIFRTRIELRQIGVRDEARSLGGFGSCGRPLCCSEFLSDFVPVSIKMAKEQNLSLNPTKISGVCGRLMCCLKYEEEAYEELNSTMPALGDYVATNDGMRGEVSGINVLRQIAKVLVEVGDDKELRDYPAGDITVLRRKKGKRNGSHIGLAAEDSPEMLALLEDEAREKSEENRKPDNRGDKNDRGDRKGGSQSDNGVTKENRDNNRNGNNGNNNSGNNGGNRNNGNGAENGGGSRAGANNGGNGGNAGGNNGNGGGENGGNRRNHRNHRNRHRNGSGGGNNAGGNNGNNGGAGNGGGSGNGGNGAGQS